MDTLLDYFLKWEIEKADEIFLRQPFGNKWKNYSWKYVGECARKIAFFLQKQNIEPRSSIAIISKNCAEWIIIDIAIALAGHISVPIYHNINSDDLQFILNSAEVKVLFVGKLDQWKKRKEKLSKNIITIRLPHYKNNEFVRAQHNYDKIIERYQPITAIVKPRPEDLHTIIFQEKSNGNRKGVMIGWDAIINLMNQQSLNDDLKLKDGNLQLFSYLPLNHIIEKIFVESLAIFKGAPINFVESASTFQQNLAATKPSHFIAVPRIWENFRLAIIKELGVKNIEKRLKRKFLRKSFKKKIQKKIGLSKAKLLLTQSSFIAKSTIDWYKKIGISIQEVYGTTENCALCCMMPENIYINDSVGKAIKGVELKISETNNEVLMKSSWLMMGYLNEPYESEKVLKGGFLKTGDCGEILTNGHLKLFGKIEDRFNTLNGAKIYPLNIENKFKGCIFIEQVAVVGENLIQPVALVELSALAQDIDNPTIISELLLLLTDANIGVPKNEKVAKIIIVHDKWIPSNGFLTSSLALKRNYINQYYKDKLNKWMKIDKKLIWE